MTDRASTATPSTSADLARAFRALRSGLYRHLLKRVGDPGVAEDLLQEIFFKALKAMESKRAPVNLDAWLRRVAKTTVIDFYRQRRPWEPLDEAVADTQPEDEALSESLATCLKPLTGQLPPIYRDTLMATAFAGKSIGAIAADSGLSLSAIKSQASRGRRLLRERLLECCHVETAGGTVTDFYPRSATTCGGGKCDCSGP